MEAFEPTIVLYEECSPREWKIYRFDNPPIKDGAWHSVGDGVDAAYRVVSGRLQYLRVECRYDDQPEARDLHRFLSNMEPIGDEFGVVEIWLGRNEEGYFARDYNFEAGATRAAPMPGLGRKHLVNALRHIVGLD